MTETVLITGGCGFIGRHVTKELLDHGYKVRLLDSLVEQVHGGLQPEIPAQAEMVAADLRDRASLRQALRGADKVVHLAAEVGVGQSMYEIERYVGTNDLGTAVLLEELADSDAGRVVVASSMSIYGEGSYVDEDDKKHDGVSRNLGRTFDGDWDPLSPQGRPLRPVPTDETKPPNLASIYALTKYFQEQAVLIHARAYQRQAVALRLFNVYGAGQALSNPYTGVLANFASRIASGQAPMIFEDGHQRRDFVHVRDVAKAFRLALEKPAAAGHAINIGSGDSYTVIQVAELLAEAMGAAELQPEILHKARVGDIRHCFADISKARDLLGYEPTHVMQRSLADFIEWVRSSGGHTDGNARMRRELETRGLVV